MTDPRTLTLTAPDGWEYRHRPEGGWPDPWDGTKWRLVGSDRIYRVTPPSSDLSVILVRTPPPTVTADDNVTVSREALTQMLGYYALPPFGGLGLGGDIDCAPIAERIGQSIDRLIAGEDWLPPDTDPDDGLLMEAWGLLANVSGGDWLAQSPEWQEAVVRWRDRFHASLPTAEPEPDTVTITEAQLADGLAEHAYAQPDTRARPLFAALRRITGEGE